MWTQRLWWQVRRFIPLSLYAPLALGLRLKKQVEVRLSRRSDRRRLQRDRLNDVPPIELRYRVTGNGRLPSYLATGIAGRESLVAALHGIGKDVDDFRSVLDFGCGCGRVFRAFNPPPAHWQMHGADVDRRAIEWCSEHLDWGEFQTVSHLPPTSYRDHQFDLIWAISVFTHLDEERQFRWLTELQRILAPGGVLLASVHGRYCWERLHRRTVNEIAVRGFQFARTNAYGRDMPEWYQVAWHSQEYVQREWSRFFEIADYRPQGMMGGQDLVVLRGVDSMSAGDGNVSNETLRTRSRTQTGSASIAVASRAAGMDDETSSDPALHRAGRVPATPQSSPV